MSLSVVFKGPEGLVLAADSRVTLTTQSPGGEIIHSHFDNATKLLRVEGQDFVGVVTYGAGAIGQVEPRTAHSFVPEFEAHLSDAEIEGRLHVEEFARHLGEFFLARWNEAQMPGGAGQMVFLVSGYDQGDAYGKVYEVSIPTNPVPSERNPGSSFGVTWGGQLELVDRLVVGMDSRARNVIQQELGIDGADLDSLWERLRQNLALPIPYQFLPLQDCVDLSMYLVRMTATLQTWTIGVRGVGGAIDVATITRTDGFRPIQQKRISGDG